MWDLPGPGLEPVSPAGGFSTTAPPGKPIIFDFFKQSLVVFVVQILHFLD